METKIKILNVMCSSEVEIMNIKKIWQVNKP